jgi:hypothetical protein
MSCKHECKCPHHSGGSCWLTTSMIGNCCYTCPECDRHIGYTIGESLIAHLQQCHSQYMELTK